MIDLLERPSTSSGHSPVALAAPTLAGLNDFLRALAIYAAVMAHDVAAFKALSGKAYTDFCSLENFLCPLPARAHRGIGSWRWHEAG